MRCSAGLCSIKSCLARAYCEVTIRRTSESIVDGGGLGVVALPRTELAAEEHLALLLAERQRPELVAHAPLAHHAARELGGVLDVVAGARGDLVEDRAPRRCGRPWPWRCDRAPRTSFAVEPVFLGQHLGEAQRRPARDDGDLVHRVAAPARSMRDQGVARLVPGGDRFSFSEMIIDCAARRPSAPCPWRTRSRGCRRRSLFLRAAISAASLTRFSRSAPEKPGVPRAMHLEVDLRRRAALLRVCTLRMPSRPFTSGRGTTMRRSKRPGRRSGGIEHVGPVGGGDEDHAFVGLEAVHLHEELVQRLLALVVAAAQAGAAVTADGVDLVDEDDAGRVLLALLEEVAHAARRRRRRTSPRSRSRRWRRRGRPPRRRWRGRAASCRCPEGPSAARPWGCGRRAW